jgi:hypothetical protein
MARIAFILLCHKDPEGIAAQAESLTAAGDCVAIHFDGNAAEADYRRLRDRLSGNPGVVLCTRRVKCGWGEWSLVEGTLVAVRAAVEAFPDATHFYMLSGDCIATKSAEYAHRFLDAEEADYIESFDFFESDWIKTGIKEERLHYRHLVNERAHKRLFYGLLEVQKRLRLARKVPDGIRVMIGSQWWCLRRRTVEAVLDFIETRRDVVRFFRTTWIPDETFFQTLVRHLVPERELRTRTLTFLMFTDYGMPVTFHNDHYDLLLAQDYLFARKVSPHALDLKARLGSLYASGRTDFAISGEGRRLYAFLAGRGREGRRFAPRFWERESTLGRQRELMIVACKKWHVGKRLLERVRQVTNTPAIDYLFNEVEAGLPDLGGVETTLAKRNRHRRALVKMLFDYYDTNRLVFCLDPSDIDTMDDFFADRCVTKLLEVDCRFSDDYLAGHARRIGLAGDRTPADVLARLMPTIRYDIQFESERIRDRGFPRSYRLREEAPADENALALAAFLDIPEAKAREIAATDHLFID